LGTPGAQTSVDVEWNYRFGIYKNNASPANPDQQPDFSGYAYTAQNWPSKQNAWSGTPGGTGTDPNVANFLTMRAAFASYDNTGTNVNGGDAFTGLNLSGGYKTLAAPGIGGDHQKYGYSRRVTLVPVLNAGSAVIDYLCVFLLQPMTGPGANVQVEIVGNAGNAGSPCSTNGIPGGSAGPLVPVLVR
jgi:hypothetical protein